MKKAILILSIFVITGLSAVAQKEKKPNLGKAENALKNGKLDEAKAIIDRAIEHEKTKDNGKTWYFRGLIYAAIDSSSNPAFHSLSDKPLQIAADAFAKATKLNEGNNEYYTVAETGLPVTMGQQIEEIWGAYINSGAKSFEAKDYAAAIQAFHKSQIIKPEDTTGYVYAAIAARIDKQHDVAMQNYENLIKIGHGTPDVYKGMIYIERAVNQDNEKALSILKEAIEAHPDDMTLMKELINVLLVSEKLDEALVKLEESIAREPDNPTMYYQLAYIYDQLPDYEKARKNYKRATELKPDYVEAYYFLGVSYYNEAAGYVKEANMMEPDVYRKEGQQVEEKAKECFRNSLPSFEKALELSPGDENTLQALETVYNQLGMNEKGAEISKKLDELGVGVD